MELYIAGESALEYTLNLNENKGRNISPHVKQSITQKIIPNLNDSDKDNLYYTFWMIIERSKNRIVAEICFKGEPDENGVVEVGYATYDEYQGNGFMTEALRGIMNWTFEQKKVTKALAETNPGNMASIRVLEKNNFSVKEKTETNVTWVLQKK